MVKFRFNLDGVVYQDGVANLVVSFDAAHSALQQRVAKAEADAAEYDRSIADGAEPYEERDEEGHLLYRQSDVLEYHIRDALDAAQTLRKAFAITIYHFWERNALRWIGKSQIDHKKLVKKVQQIGYPIDPEIDNLRLLVNLLKHNNVTWGTQLYDARPDLFSSLFTPSEKTVNWESRVILQEHHIVEFMNTIAQSGPHTETLKLEPAD